MFRRKNKKELKAADTICDVEPSDRCQPGKGPVLALVISALLMASFNSAFAAEATKPQKVCKLVYAAQPNAKTIASQPHVISLGLFGKKNVLKKIISRGQQSGTFADPDAGAQIPFVQPGDVIRFASGHEFEVVRFLGSGFVTNVILVKYQKGLAALRVNRNFTLHGPSSYAKDAEILQRAGIRIPKIYEDADDFILTAYEDHLVGTLSDILQGEPNFQGYDLTFVKEKWIEFLRSTYKLAAIGDIHPRQVHFNGKEWLLVDWDHRHKVLSDYETEFSDLLTKQNIGSYPSGTVIDGMVQAIHDLENLHIEFDHDQVKAWVTDLTPFIEQKRKQESAKH